MKTRTLLALLGILIVLTTACAKTETVVKNEYDFRNLVPEFGGVGQIFVDGDLEGDWQLIEGESRYHRIVIEDNYPEPLTATLFVANEERAAGLYSKICSEDRISLSFTFSEGETVSEESFLYNFGYTLDGALMLRDLDDENMVVYVIVGSDE